MPYFYGYGRVSTDKQAMSPETQRDLIFKDFTHRKAMGTIPSDMEWGGFVADTDVSRAVKFLHRPMGGTMALKMKPGDFLCVAAYDRLIGSLIDGHETLQWIKQADVNLIIIGMNVDTSTPLGKFFFDMMGAVKDLERAEIGRRTREGLSYRRSQGRPTASPPIGYKVMNLIPLAGGPMVKWYMPNPSERRYAKYITELKDVHKLSFNDIALKFYNNHIKHPRTGKRQKCDPKCIFNYYHAMKKGWPLHGGIQWRKPDFKYTIAHNTIDLRRVSA